MNDDPAHRADEEARAKHIAHDLARHAGWTIDETVGALATAFAGTSYCEEPQLLLMPTSLACDYVRPKAENASRQARSDVLIVSSDGREISFALGLWHLDTTQWRMSQRLWMANDGLFWIVSETASLTDGSKSIFTGSALQRCRLRLTPVCLSHTENAEGLLRALDWLSLHAVTQR